ncbi:MAG: hypothetical protein L6R35_001363 [Caloplaca aegaea]|nr:MAG: hypothetical protein L6R35_001363 [Caloplaca aegaea]
MKAAILSVLASLAPLAVTIAVPLEKRVLVIETVTDVVVTTIESTTTVWGKPQKSTHPAHVAQHAHHQAHKHQASAGRPEKAAALAPAHRSEPTPIPTSQSFPESPSPPAVINKAPAPAPASAATSPQQPSPIVQQAAKQATPALAPAAYEVPPPPASSPQHSTSIVVPPPARQADSDPKVDSTADCGKVGMPCAGEITYYDTAGAFGACGWINDGTTENVFALAHGMMGIQSNGNPFCGRHAEVSLDGKTVVGKLVDKCGGCEGQDIDLSHAMFQALADEDKGRISNVKWHFVD